jgi:putative endonuclease
MLPRARRSQRAQSLGVAAEATAERALTERGWTVLARRLRTKAGEIDLVVTRDGLLVFAEVKARPYLADAARALTPRQRDRLLAAADIVLAEHPDWGPLGARFDLLLVDAAGRVRRIQDAFRREDAL